MSSSTTNEGLQNVPLQETGHNGDAQLKSVLNKQVSFFASYLDTKSQPIPLLHFLTKRAYVKEIALIRETTDKKSRDILKARIGAITPSGLFSERKASALLTHSGLIQFDIDFKENAAIPNYSELKQQICNIKNVAYCGLSVSGNGYWGLIPIAHPAKHKQHFTVLQKMFAQFGIIIDQSCSDVSRLRGYSYDENAYFDHNAKPFYLYEENKPSPGAFTAVPSDKQRSSNEEKMNTAIAYIQENRIDITDGYQNWFGIGASIAAEFGEKGRIFFHNISSQNNSYDPKETDMQYSNCMKGSKHSFGTFIFHCKKHQIPV